MPEKFDVGLIVFMANNYGSALTNIALYHAIEKLGLSVVVLDTLATPTGISNHYVKHYLNASSAYSKKGNYRWANESCDSFVVGSDQCWRWDFPRFQKNLEYYLMAFASQESRKVSYASSFGAERFDIDDDLKRLFSHLLNRFDYVSVREDYAVTMCRDLFGVEAAHVADPVFLLSKEDYAPIAERSGLKKKDDYLLAYILEPTKEKRELIYAYAEQTGLEPVVICDGREFQRKRALLDMPEILDKPNVPEWLFYLSNASFVLTDSFHGTCFSLINGIDFVSIKRGARQRFDSLARIIESSGSDAGCIVDDVESAFEAGSHKVGFAKTEQALSDLKDVSLQWLDNALTGPLPEQRKMPNPWMDYAKMFRKNLDVNQDSRYRHANSRYAERVQYMQEGDTFLQAVCKQCNLAAPPSRDFQGIDELEDYMKALGDKSRYTFLFSCKGDCGSFWNRFVKRSGLPLVGELKSRVSYIAAVCGDDVLYQQSSRKPLNKLLKIQFKDGETKPIGEVNTNSAKHSKGLPFGVPKNSGECESIYVYLYSMRTDKENFTQKSVIQVNSVDYSMDASGLNVVVVENETAQVVDSFYLDLLGDKDTKIHRSY